MMNKSVPFLPSTGSQSLLFGMCSLWWSQTEHHDNQTSGSLGLLFLLDHEHPFFWRRMFLNKDEAITHFTEPLLQRLIPCVVKEQVYRVLVHHKRIQPFAIFSSSIPRIFTQYFKNSRDKKTSLPHMVTRHWGPSVISGRCPESTKK